MALLRKEMCYLMTYWTPFIYGYMALHRTMSERFYQFSIRQIFDAPLVEHWLEEK